MHNKTLSDLSPTLSPARLLVLYLIALAVPSFGFGQPVECTDDPTNALRLTNCGFNSGIAGWSILWGTDATHNLVEGNPSPGSYQIVSLVDDEDDRAITIRSPCVPIAPSSTYQIEGQFKLMDPLDAVQCEIAGVGYSDDNCTSSQTVGTDDIEIRVSGSEWTSVSNTYIGQPDNSSMDIVAICYEDGADPAFTALLDNFIVAGPPAPIKINAAMGDAWFFPGTDGQGFFINVWETEKLVFMAWFTYETERPPDDVIAFLGEPGHRWIIGLGPYNGDTADLEVFLSQGMIFDSGDPPVDTTPYEGATIKIVWSECNKGLLTYDIPTLNLMGEIEIERIVLDNVPACEAAQP